MIVAAIQLCAGTDPEKNLQKTESLIRSAVARRAECVVLPEIFSFRGKSGLARPANTMRESVSGGPTVKALSQWSREFGVFVVGGSIRELPRKSASQEKAYNTTVVVDPKGRVIGVYRKKFLFEASLDRQKVDERKVFLAGHRDKMVRMGEFQSGLAICYDLRFPRMFRGYAQKGAQMICVPSCFTKETGEAHWHVLVRARALDALSYVIAPNQYGTDDRGIQAYGHSLIVSPWGEILAEASGNKDEVIVARISVKEVREARKKLSGVLKKRAID